MNEPQREQPASRTPPGIPSWRRRVPFYLLMGVGAIVVIQFLENRPREIDLFFVVTGLDVQTSSGRLDRNDLVELSAEIREGEEIRATTTWNFRRGAPMKIGPARVRLRKGECDVHFRLTFETENGERRLFALRRRLAVTGESDFVLLDVADRGI